jgi:hypothetical protein
MTQKLLTLPPELVQQWCHEDGDEIKTSPRWFHSVCAKAAQWGADQRGTINEAELQKARDEELKACCKVLEYQFMADSIHLRAARRPKPPTRKEALEALERMQDLYPHMGNARTIRRALEALND